MAGAAIRRYARQLTPGRFEQAALKDTRAHEQQESCGADAVSGEGVHGEV